ncbi:MAG: hypothetical protein Q8Q31_04930 [Nanoarchaeota archaeon]|nr:hypothetical protein [Nanoarchaeota archaeon]
MSINVKPVIRSDKEKPIRPLDRVLLEERAPQVETYTAPKSAMEIVKEKLLGMGWEYEENNIPSGQRFSYEANGKEPQTPERSLEGQKLNSNNRGIEDKVENYVPDQDQESFMGRVKRNLVATQGGLVTLAMPVYISLEKLVVGMTDFTSQNTRAMAILLGLAGLTTVYSKNREKIHESAEKICNYFGREFDESKMRATDVIYGGLFTAVVNPVVYTVPALITNAFKWEECGKTSLLGLGMGACLGVFMGCGVDLFQDLWGYKKSDRIKKGLRSLPLKTKRLIANGLCAASITLSSWLYNIPIDNSKYGGEPAAVFEAVELYYGLDLSTQGEADNRRDLREYNDKMRLNWENRYKPKVGI